MSLAYFPQSNSRAEVAVKAAQRLLIANVSTNTDLNYDLFLRALLQLRNTPHPDCDRFPAEIVFGQPLRDAFSFDNRFTKFTIRLIQCTWGEAPKRTSFVCELDATTLHYAQTASFVPFPVMTACSSKIKQVTMLVNGIKLAQLPKPCDFINMLSRWVDRYASLNVTDGSSVLSHKRYTTTHCSAHELSYPLLQTSHHVVQQLTRAYPPRCHNNPSLLAP